MLGTRCSRQLAVRKNDTFEPRVSGTRGEWPDGQDFWSYSSLRQVEQCPLQWMLSNATYPDLWSRRGYPRLIDVSPFCGTVVHRAVERIVKALHVAECSSVADPKAVNVLREL